jgi:uncharacterized protein YndB with AHSA1/START domain
MSADTPAASPAPAAATPPAGRRRSTVFRVAIVLIVALVLFLGFVALQPTEFRIARSQRMAAEPATVFAQVNDFHHWEDWSPWIKLDPNAKATFEGPSEGEGAIFRWAGNAEVGEGSMTITDSRPHERIRIRLDFLKPFEDTADAEFTFEPQGDETLVTWSMSGQNNFIGKLFCLFMDMDEMIGSKFEEGLASIQAIVEQPAANDGAPVKVTPEAAQ